MTNNLVAKSSVLINAPISKVWEALTTPEMIKKYLFGTETTSDWTVGSAITYKGVWEGKSYEDKGTILEFVPEKSFISTYWSGMSGLPDTPENYSKVSYELTEENGQVRLNLTQDNNKDEESRAHSEKNWSMVLQTLKELLEKD